MRDVETIVKLVFIISNVFSNDTFCFDVVHILILTHSHKVVHIFLTRAASDVQNLNGGQFYYLEVLHVETTGSDFLGVGITLPDGTTLHPINKTYLWREKPGNVDCLVLKGLSHTLGGYETKHIF